MNKQLITVIKEPVGIVIKPPAFVPRNYTIVETGSGDWTARTPNNEIIDYAPTANLAEDLCIRHAARNLHRLARANGYVKLEPGQVVVDTKVWLPYLVKAINAAKILQKHGAFTVKHYHGDWPSLEMLEGLKGAIDGQPKDGK